LIAGPGTLIERLVRGNALRRTRLHDEKGNGIDARGLAYAPLVVAQAALRRVFGYRP
jgi:hypothetical protein